MSGNIFSMEVPRMYSDDLQQSMYASEYRNGWLMVRNKKENLSISHLEILREECIRGRLDGLRDAILAKQRENEK